MPTEWGLTEAAKRAGVTAGQAPNYVQFRLLPAATRTARGHYSFDEAAVNRLRLIGLATRAGLRLDAMRPLLAALDNRDTSALKSARETIESCIRERRQTLRQLAQQLNRACDAPGKYGGIAAKRP